jgi:hypothetical protein
MQRSLFAICCLLVTFVLSGCANVIPSGLNVLVDVSNPFTYAQVGSAPVTLMATTKYDGTNKGVKWALTTANVGCSPGCGNLNTIGHPSFSAVYTPPADTPVNQQATITAFSVAEGTQDFSFTFSIIPPASVQITNKFASILTAAAPVQVNAAVTNDPTNSGVTWTLTVGGNLALRLAALSLPRRLQVSPPPTPLRQLFPAAPMPTPRSPPLRSSIPLRTIPSPLTS